MKKALMIIVVAALALGALWFIVREDDTSTETPTVTNTENTPSDESSDSEAITDQAASSTSVAISDFSFTPALITVKKGSTVTWTNNDSVEHTITSDEGSTMDSELLAKGDTYSVTFNETGTFTYHCKPHPNMTGSVVVTE